MTLDKCSRSLPKVVKDSIIIKLRDSLVANNSPNIIKITLLVSYNEAKGAGLETYG